MPAHLIPERGNRYVNLTVLRHSHTTRSGSVWECLCGGCGRVAYVAGSALRSGRTRSCGCLRTALLSLRASERNRRRAVGAA